MHDRGLLPLCTPVFLDPDHDPRHTYNQRNADGNVGGHERRLPGGGGVGDDGSGGDAVHGVGVGHGVEDAMGGIPNGMPTKGA